MSMQSETELVKLAQQGDESAFSLLVEQNQRRIYNLALRMTRNPDDAAELTQDAFLNAWRDLANFRARALFPPGSIA